MQPNELLYTAQQTRDLDRCAIEEHGLPGLTLMSRAARATYEELQRRWPDPARVTVLCGTGNNGGDGYLIADLAHKAGIPTVVLQVGDNTRISGDAAVARQQALGNGVPEEAFSESALLSVGVIVDAMLGTGLGGDVRANYAAAIDAVNASTAPVLAVDTPSGLCADTGRVLGRAVRADCSVSFIGRKRGLYTAEGPDHCGERCFADLGVPPEVYAQIPAGVERVRLHNALAQLPARPASAHKGMYGAVLVVGGDAGMGGAGVMAAEAALRCGAGLVSLATRTDHVAAALARRPEVMVHAVANRHQLEPLLAAATVVAVGPGLGQRPWGQQLLQRVLESECPLLLDADALNLLAQWQLPARDNWILTPHPGEAARLLGCSSAEVQADRFAAVSALQQRYGGVVLLKGCGTLIADGESLWLTDDGNPGMASGGMGDVLSGVIAGLWAQGMLPATATVLGACAHGAAADSAAGAGMRGLAATDLMPELRSILG